MTDLSQGLYWDPEVQKFVSTHSMLKTFRQCPQQTLYKYVERLKPRVMGRPLREGTWMHALLETKYKGGDWRKTHKKLLLRWDKLFDEEKDMIGDMPRDCYRLMQSYEWHYEHEEWEVLEVEYVIEVPLPDGTMYRARIDLLVRDPLGLWIVDHKFNAKLPDLTFRILDAASALYIWAARKAGIPVDGFMWNYVRRKAPTVPRVIKDGTRFYATDTDYDYPTLVRAIKRHGFEPRQYRRELLYHRGLQYRPGEPQRSTYFRRDYLVKDNRMLRKVAMEALHTSKRMNSYPFDRREYVERNPTFQCSRCNYEELCSLELFGGEQARNLRRQRFTVTDPLYYYHDDPANPDGRGEL